MQFLLGAILLFFSVPETNSTDILLKDFVQFLDLWRDTFMNFGLMRPSNIFYSLTTHCVLKIYLFRLILFLFA